MRGGSPAGTGDECFTQYLGETTAEEVMGIIPLLPKTLYLIYN